MASKYGAEWQAAYQQFPEKDRPVGGVTWPEYQQLVLNVSASGVTISVPSGLITLTGDTVAGKDVASPPSGLITVTGNAPAVAVVANPPSGQIAVTGDAPAGKVVASPPSGLISVNAAAPTGKVTATVPSAAVAVTGDAPTFKLAANPPSAAITLTGNAPAVTDAEIIPSGLVELTANAPAITDFAVAAATDTSTAGGNKLFGPPRRPIVPAPLVDHRVYRVRPARIRVYANAAATTVEYDANPAHVHITAATPASRFRYQAPIADGVLVARAVPAPSRVDTDKAFADLVRDVYIASNA